jgi:AAA+ ATPase superfamily predicted ATPase
MDSVIIDREREQERLRELVEDPAPQMALVYGRRRVGKTYLLTHLWSLDDL